MPAILALLAGGTALAVGAALMSADPTGRLLVSIAALGLWVIAGLAFRQRPRLAIVSAPSGPSILMTRLTRTHTYTPDEIRRVKVMEYPRLGRRVPMLELDVQHAGDPDDRLVIFGRWDLGASPREVYDALVTYGLAIPED